MPKMVQKSFSNFSNNVINRKFQYTDHLVLNVESFTFLLTFNKIRRMLSKSKLIAYATICMLKNILLLTSFSNTISFIVDLIMSIRFWNAGIKDYRVYPKIVSIKRFVCVAFFPIQCQRFIGTRCQQEPIATSICVSIG